MTKDIESVSKVLDSKGHTYLQWAAAVLANVMVISYGMQIGWLSSVVGLMQSDHSPAGRPLTESEVAWIASLPCLLSTFSPSPYSWIVDRYGRRFGIITVGFWQVLCWLLKLTANPTCIIISRVFTGIAAGACSNIIPMYIKEISQDNMRGILGMLVMQSQNIGVLIMYGVGAYVDYYVVLWAVIGIPVINSLLMMKAPESPVYLVKIGKVKEAEATIASLRGLSIDDIKVQNQMDNIKKEDEDFKSTSNVNFISIFKNKAWRNSFIIMLIIMSIRGLNGGMAIIMYASTILTRSGVTINPELQSLSFPVFMIIGSFAAMTCVERVGRRPLLVLTHLMAVASFASLAAIIMVQDAGWTVPGWLTVLVIVVGVFANAAGVSPLPFIICAEMFNFQIRAKVMGILVGIAWFTTFIQLLAFAPITNTYGAHVSFLCFVVFNLIGIVVTVFYLPETKGRNIEEIENALIGNKNKNNS